MSFIDQYYTFYILKISIDRDQILNEPWFYKEINFHDLSVVHIDDCRRKVWIYLLQSKYATFIIIKEWKIMVEIRIHKKNSKNWELKMALNIFFFKESKTTLRFMVWVSL